MLSLGFGLSMAEREAAEVDPYAAYVVALLYFTGADGSTTFTDEKGHTFTGVGNAQINGNELLLDGAGDYIQSSGSDDFNVGSSDFVIEGFYTPDNATGAAQGIVYINDAFNETLGLRIMKDGGFSRCFVGVSMNGTTETHTAYSPLGSLSTGVRRHFAAVRSGTTLSMYVNGSRDAGNTADIGAGAVALQSPRKVFTTYSTSYVAGKLDSLRITVGTDRGYTGDTIEIPTEPF